MSNEVGLGLNEVGVGLMSWISEMMSCQERIMGWQKDILMVNGGCLAERCMMNEGEG